MAWDLQLLALVQGQARESLTWAMLFFTAIGSGWALLALVPLLVRPSTRRFAAHLLGAVIVTAAIVFVTKHVVRRVRPCAGITHAIGLAAPTDPSFPSGHAAGSATVATFAWIALRRRATAPTLLRDAPYGVGLASLAGGVGLSRVYLGVHFPSDVLAGALVGVIVGGLSARRLEGPTPAPRIARGD